MRWVKLALGCFARSPLEKPAMNKAIPVMKGLLDFPEMPLRESLKGLEPGNRFHVTSAEQNAGMKEVMDAWAMDNIGISHSSIRNKRETEILIEQSLELPLMSRIKLPKISYVDIVKATHGFDKANILGKSNSASLYKGLLSNGSYVAVKVFNLMNKDAHWIFTAECKVLKEIRHRNLVKIGSICSTDKFTALIYKFMCNESLEKHLHSFMCNELGVKQRLNIAIDLAHAIEYLHHDCHVQIVHSALKPSNVLLDQDMTAHLSDFGIARIAGLDTPDYEDLKGTLGYIAPECAVSGRISTERDVYSYGILLLEMVTGKKPTNNMFEGDLTLHKWVNSAFLNRVLDVVDQRLLTEATDNEIQIVVSLLRIGLWCSNNTVKARPTMKEVSTVLEIIKEEWLRDTSSSVKLKRSLSDQFASLFPEHSESLSSDTRVVTSVTVTPEHCERGSSSPVKLAYI
ncbi:hypothetical protein KI387_002411 [Taxus chinensis]|uniref:non-specific serine/threonine protein kinase n=1 Tax=Taxus chinensis TaxID=29808 RepID=A0AA38LM81_TAXCH|nr:hypothetical protein KI387_002411 [Taxus chinensis]